MQKHSNADTQETAHKNVPKKVTTIHKSKVDKKQFFTLISAEKKSEQIPCWYGWHTNKKKIYVQIKAKNVFFVFLFFFQKSIEIAFEEYWMECIVFFLLLFSFSSVSRYSHNILFELIVVKLLCRDWNQQIDYTREKRRENENREKIGMVHYHWVAEQKCTRVAWSHFNFYRCYWLFSLFYLILATIHSLPLFLSQCIQIKKTHKIRAHFFSHSFISGDNKKRT